MLVKGVFESGFWAILVLLFIIINNLKKKKKKTRKKSNKKFTNISSKKEKVTTKNSAPIFSNLEFRSNNHKYNNSDPINQTEQFFKDKEKLARIRQMKSLTVGDLHTISFKYKTAKLFYLQGSFMDDFEDDYEINVPCNLNNPTYNNLNIYQLRSYFSWRTLVKSGKYNQTEISYVYLYIYELLNKIGVKNEIDGLNKLIELWQNYRIYDTSIDNYLPIWLKDYYVVNGLKIDYKLIEEEFPIKIIDDTQIISEIMIGNYENKLNFFDENSSYHILKSKLMEHKYNFIVPMILPTIFIKLDKYFNESGYSFNEILFGYLEKQSWEPFKGAIYYDNPLNKDFQVSITPYEKYYKVKDSYYKEAIFKSEASKDIMGYILKTYDIVLRECLKFTRNLKVNENMLDSIKEKDNNLYLFLTSQKIIDIINITVKKYLIENKIKINNIITEKKKQEIFIDIEKFNDIRESSGRVQKKLVVEEPIEEVKTIVEEKSEEINHDSNDIFVNLVNSLNDIEIEFIKKLVNSESRSSLIDYSKENNILYEIMIENINNKSLETIGDNLIEDYVDQTIIYAEYIDSIKEKVGGN